jgi:hypothetical protein
VPQGQRGRWLFRPPRRRWQDVSVAALWWTVDGRGQR